jgi:hypothetical protein
MHSIRSLSTAAIVAALAVGGCASPQVAPAQHGAAEQQGSASRTMAVKAVTAAATVTGIDKAGGKLTLKGAEGNTFEVKAGPRVNLDRLKVGDRVRATYYEEIAVGINRATPGAPKVAQTTIERGGVTARQATATARILSVDAKKNTVAIRTPDGNTHALHVQDPDLQQRLKQIKPGDNFDITYTQAVAISVEPRK